MNIDTPAPDGLLASSVDEPVARTEVGPTYLDQIVHWLCRPGRGGESRRRGTATLTAAAASLWVAACGASMHGAPDRFREMPCDDSAAFAQRAADGAGRPSPADLARAWIATCGLDEVVALTQDLIRFQTVSAEESAADGESFAAMREYLTAWSTEAGLRFNAVGANDAWEIAYGSGERQLAIVMHGDVVPAPSPAGDALPAGWSQPPFAGTLSTGRLYGRGSEDDKGPIAAALVVLRAMRRFGVEPRGQILAIIGNGEEHDWAGMIRYAGSQPHARFIVSVDASFPVVVAESGFVAWRLFLPLETGAPLAAKPRILDASGGSFLTQVPGSASMSLAPGKGTTTAALLEKARAAVRAERDARGDAPFGFDVAEIDGKVRITVTGDAVHSSVADTGHNAIWPLAAVAGRLDVEESPRAMMLRLIRDRFDGDHWGEKLGLAYESDLMGRLLVAPTVLGSDTNGVTLAVNMRRPDGRTAEQFNAALDAALASIQKELDPRFQEVEDRYVGDPAMADISGPLVATLLDVYRAHTGDRDSEPIRIRGGTYARLFPGAVSFGPALPGDPYRGHAPDEYIELRTLDLLTQMLLDAALRLGAIAAQ